MFVDYENFDWSWADRGSTGGGYVDSGGGGLAPAADPQGSASAGNSTSPVDLGVEWLTGEGPRQQTFGDGDPMTVQLQGHSHIESVRDTIRERVRTDGQLSGFSRYDLSGIQGVPKYFSDYATLLTLGQAGNLTVTFLGSYAVEWRVGSVNSDGSADVLFHAWNTSSLQSATRPPVLGYVPGWSSVGAVVNSLVGDSGPMSTTRQDFIWRERIR